MERIRDFFRVHSPVSDDAWSFFKERLHLRHYKSGELIIQPLKTSDKLCFILEGVARSYLQKPDGRDFTWFFHYDAEDMTAKQFILVDYPSFTLRAPSTYGFQALSQSSVACISHAKLTETFQEYPEFLAVEKLLVINAYQQNNLRLQAQLTKPAKERLEDFEKVHQLLFKMIPQYHIASYLGITPQRLCQLRRGRTVRSNSVDPDQAASA
jgi:CRP-like cAMP-binding protein